MIKYPTTPQKCRYTTLWNVCAQKSQSPKAEWSELPCQTLPFKLKAFAQKYSPSDVGIVFVHWQKDIYNDHSEKLADWPTVRTPINRRHKTPTQYAHN